MYNWNSYNLIIPILLDYEKIAITLHHWPTQWIAHHKMRLSLLISLYTTMYNDNSITMTYGPITPYSESMCEFTYAYASICIFSLICMKYCKRVWPWEPSWPPTVSGTKYVAFESQQGKYEGFERFNRPRNSAQIRSKSSIFRPAWGWPEKQ